MCGVGGEVFRGTSGALFLSKTEVCFGEGGAECVCVGGGGGGGVLFFATGLFLQVLCQRLIQSFKKLFTYAR